MQIELIRIIKINYLIGEDISHLFYVINVMNTTLLHILNLQCTILHFVQINLFDYYLAQCFD